MNWKNLEKAKNKLIINSKIRKIKKIKIWKLLKRKDKILKKSEICLIKLLIYLYDFF